MTFNKDNLTKNLIILLIFLSLTFRIICIPHTNYDMIVHNVPWYMTLYQEGIIKSMATEFANYSPPYTYFLALATFTHDFIPPLTAIKLIPMCFDVLGTFLIYKIVRLKFQKGPMPGLAAAIYFTLPTVILNSASWGQADSLYTFFLLVCLYFVLKEKPFVAILGLGLAFSIKAQATFFLPFLAIMAIRKKIPWLYFGMMPLMYLLAILPVVLVGRPFLDALLIYKKQSLTYSAVSMYAPNAYLLIPNEWYSIIAPVGILGTVVLLAYWIYITSRSRINFEDKHIILIAFLSVALAPFLLPKMHDRYFYPADVLSIVLAFYWPALWFIPILYQFASTSAITIFLFDVNTSFVVFGFLFNAIALTTVLRTQRLAEDRGATNPKISSALSWLAAILTPLVLLGISINLLLTPAFIRLEYAMPHIATNSYSMSKSERFRWAYKTIGYLTNDKQTQYLERLEFDDGSAVFNNHEIAIIDNTKNSTQKIFKYWDISLAATFILGLLAWAGGWLPKFRQGVKRGGWITIGLTIVLGIVLILNPIDFGAYYQNADILLILFPIRFWQDLLLFTAIGSIIGGSLLAISLARIESTHQT
jgi:Gpi18-like mannosyltransferase